MHWLLGCLGLVFIVVGGPCVLFSAAGLFDSAEGFEGGLFVQGMVIVLLGAWAIYKAVRMRRLPTRGGAGRADE